MKFYWSPFRAIRRCAHALVSGGGLRLSPRFRPIQAARRERQPSSCHAVRPPRPTRAPRRMMVSREYPYALNARML